jgi:hypothetical protein
MAEFEKTEFKYPDEVENTGKPEEDDGSLDISIEIEDDTPDQDKGQKPLPKELVDKLEVDELDKYSGEAKEKLVAMKKVWHDERRRADQAERERQAALDATQRLLDENRRLKTTLSSGEREYLDTVKNASDLELEVAKRAYKEALEGGDPDRIVETQEKMNNASYRANQIKNYRPTLQEQENEVQIPQVQERRTTADAKTQEWTEKNQWFGSKKGMTAYALGVHEELADEYGQDFVGTNRYYEHIDKTMRKVFPDYFDTMEAPEEQQEEPQKAQRKASTVVAPATRSTSSKQVKLKLSQQAIAKKLGLTNEQYVRELLKLES